MADVPASDIHGDWVRITDTSAAGGAALHNPNRSRAKVTPALSDPTHYVEARFQASAGIRYHLWVRMRAENDAWSGDSVHLQFSDSVGPDGAPYTLIGTISSAEVVLQDGPNGAAPLGWGWSDNGWGAAGPDIRFATTGTHAVRVQQREDGAIIDQIVLSPDLYAATPPGSRQNDTTVLAPAGGIPPASPLDTIVIWSASIPDARVFGAWQRLAETGAAGGAALGTSDGGMPKIAPALGNPGSYFETTFPAAAGKPYHVWLRMRASGDMWSNDSVHVQFDRSLDSSGVPVARTGTSNSAEFVLQAGPNGAAPRGWGWTENGWGTLGPHVFFETSGTQTIRVQQREDGAVVDQIVISADTYLTSSPGFRRDDTTVLPEMHDGTNQPPSAALTAPAEGATFTAPATITLTASATDPEDRLARVDFYAGSASIGSVPAAPYTMTWNSVPAGTYSLAAVALDADGASTASTRITVTVTAPAPPRRVMFTASTDHDTSVVRYLLEVFAAGQDPATAEPVASDDLGKPPPDASLEIDVDRSEFFNRLASGSYLATVAAVGVAGSSRSSPAAFTR